jgi:Uma2 family endonuclease
MAMLRRCWFLSMGIKEPFLATTTISKFDIATPSLPKSGDFAILTPMADDVAPLASAPSVTPRRFTWDEVITMSRAGVFDERERVELVGGEIIVMPEEGPLHVLALQIMQRWLLRALPADLELAVRAPLHLPDGTVFIPDIAVFQAGFSPADMIAANARLVIEISDTTLNRDQRRKLPRYADAGVGELWIVDTQGRTVIRYRAPKDAAFADVIEAHGDGDALSPLCAPLASFAVSLLPRP